MADVVVSIKANTEDIEHKLDQVTEKYETVSKLAEIGNKDMVASQDTFKESGAIGYMNDTFSQVRSVLSEIGTISSSIPQNLNQAMSSLIRGTRQAIGVLMQDMKKATETADGFDEKLNPVNVSNSIKFSSASIKQYVADMKEAISVANSMHAGTRARLDQNIQQISSAVSPAIKDITFKGHKRLTDEALVSTMLNGNNEYSHIPAMLKAMGFASPTAQRQALTFAVKTTPDRIYRGSANREYLNADLNATGHPVTAVEAVPQNYRAAYLSGARYINEKATPRVAGSNTEAQRAIYYSGIRDEIGKGNHVAFEAARKSGLVKIDKGRYQFADSVDDQMLDQFSAYVIQERSRAAQGSPEHFKSLKDSTHETTLLGKDNNGIKESDRVLRYDARAVANPYLEKNYKSTATYTGDTHQLPEFRSPETINIPQMTVRMINGKPTFVTKREKGYETGLNFGWQKSGVEQSSSDEFITMGRNPILDRLIKMHAAEGATFENRSFGYGFTDKNTARTGLPLVISMPLEDFHDKDVYKNIKFKDNANGGREAYFTGSSADLIDKLYSGELTPYLEYEDLDAQGKKTVRSVPYRAFAGSLTGGGNIKFMPAPDYEKMMDDDQHLRGIMPMLNYFNEIDKTNGKLVNPATGKGFGLTSDKSIEDDEARLGAYARFFDARNKLLSHSIPSEEMGVETPLAALVNFDAFYKARNIPKEKRFDGGAFLDPRLFGVGDNEFGTDYQGRMGPAKFAAQSFDWRKYLIDAGFTYNDKNGSPHFYMPGMSANAKDYDRFTRLQSDYLAGKMTAEQIKEFEDFRDSKFVDIMDPRYGMLLPDTTLKSTAKMGSVTTAMYNDIVKTVSKTDYTRPKALEDYGVEESFVKAIDKNSDRVKNGMVQLTPAEQTELMAMISDPRYDFGLRFMKDTENYAGEKNFWAPAYMSSVQMTPSMMEKSAENYRKAFREMSTPEGIIRRMFSGNDLDSRRVQQNKDLLYTDPNIQYAIQAEISNLERKQLLGYGYFPDAAQMFLATANPSSVFGPMGEDQTGHAAQGDAAKLKANAREIIAGTAKTGVQNWTRSPYAPGANFFAAAAARDDVLKRYGMSGNSAMFNVEDFYTLNTGDFDGDFVWAYQDLVKDPEFIRRTEERNRLAQKIMDDRAKQDELIKEQEKAEGKVSPDLGYDPSSFAQSVLRADNSIGPVGLGYKLGQAGRMIRLSQQDLAKIDAYSNITYANGIDSIKHIGLNNVQPDSKVWEAIRTRKPVERLTKELLSEFDNKEFGRTDLFDYGLPTFFDPIGYSVLTNAAEGRARRSQNYGKEVRDAIDANVNARYKGRPVEEQELAKWYGQLVSDKLTGAYQITDNKTLDEGRKRLAALNNVILDLEKTQKDSPELADMKTLASHASSAIETEAAFGFTEENLDDINRFYQYMHWENPIKAHGYRTRNDIDLATYWQERAAEDRRLERQQAEESSVDKLLRETAGVVPGQKERDDAKMRRRAAHMFTGFNWSNAHEFTEGPIELRGVHFAGLENGGYNFVDFNKAVKDPDIVYDTDGARLIVDYQHAKDNGVAKANIARGILTGETKRRDSLDAHAIIGTAAHTYMDTYGRARTTMSQEEAEKLAYQAYEDTLLGPMTDGARKLSDEQMKEHKKAGVSFSQDESGRITVAYDRDEKTQNALQEKLDKAWNDPFYSNSDPASSLINISRKFYERAFQNSNAEEHMIMSEGTQFEWDDKNNKLKQVSSRTDENGNGIWAVPMEDGKPVLGDFKRYKTNPVSGKIEEAEAGTYFTPDMIKKNKNGEITIVDWKSSLHGQKSAMAQMSFYARMLEEKGKQYYTTQDAGEKKDLEWFSQFVTQHDDGSFTSNIKRLQAVNLFSKGNDAVLTGEYGEQGWGKIVEPWLYTGMRNLVRSANKAFYDILPEAITPNFRGRHMNGQRSVIAPGEDERLYFQTLEQADLIDNKLDKAQQEHVAELFSGGTGVRDSSGSYIDQDKSYLVAKFMKDQEALEQVKSFANKQNKRLNNFDYGRQDQFTQNINQLTDLFSGEEYDALQKYLSSDSAAADLDLFAAGLNKNQVEAAQTISQLQGLRQQYVENLPKTMDLDYKSIAYGEGDIISRLRSGRYKRQGDLVALRENEKLSPYYDEQEGFILDPERYLGNIERQEGESDADYIARQDKRLEDAQKAAEAAAKEQEDFKKKETEINEAHARFSDVMLSQIKKETDNYANPFALLFNGKDLNATIAGLEKDALRYSEEADLKDGSGRNARKVYSADEQAALAAASRARKDAAESLKELEGTELGKLPNAQAEYEQAKLNARLTGTQINPNIIKQLATQRFIADYIKANPTADNDKLTSVMSDFQRVYDEEQERNNAILTQQMDDHYADQMLRQQQLRRSRTPGQRGMIGRALSLRDSWEQQTRGNRAQLQNDLRKSQDEYKQYTDENGKLRTDLTDTQKSEAGKLATQIAGYSNALKQAEADEQKFANGGGLITASMNVAGEAIGRLAQRLGRQLFQKALQETKRFVKEFDASMTTIQMITLKSDQEMSTLGDGLIAKAQELKISISEISQMSAELYRQGLSDEEMDERLDTIAKFSKVSGTKPGDATKLITTAINTGLVDNAQYAADVVTMLGDSAATNAAQIEKGIEKAGAAAAVDGTTYGQLVALLTAVTATTQVTGNVAGTTLNSIFGRMNKVGTNELIYDENGNSMSGSAIAKLLRAQGIATNNEDGSRRSTFSMLYDLAQKYDDMSDDEQRQIATAISGTRQFSNFGAIMTGIREGDIDKYLELIDKSEGITDQKFDVYTKSLQASLDNLKNTWDELVKDLIDKGVATDFIDGITTMIQGVDNLVGSFGKLKASLPLILTLLGTLAGLKLGGLFPGGAGIGALIGAGVGLAGYVGLTAAGSLSTNQSASQIYSDYEKSTAKRNSSIQQDTSRLRALYDKGQNRTDDEQKEFTGLLYKLNTTFGLSTDSLKDMASGANDATAALNELAKVTLEEADKQQDEAKVKSVYGGLDKEAAKAFEAGDVSLGEYNKSGAIYSYGLYDYLWGRDAEGNIRVNENLDTSRRYTDDQKQSLAKLLADAGSLYLGNSGVFTNENDYNSEEAWLNQIRDNSIAAFLNTNPKFKEGLNNYLAQQQLFGVESGIENRNNAIAADISSYLVDNEIVDNQDDADALAASLMKDFQAQYGNSNHAEMRNGLTKLLYEMLGYDPENPDFSPQHLADAIRDYRIEHDIPLSRKDQAFESGLEYLGEGTYYKGSDGRRYTYEEALAIQNQYDERVQQETDRIAKEPVYYYQDINGNRVYTDANGKKFETTQERDEAQKAYQAEQKIWKASYTDYNTGKYVEETGLTKAEADAALTAQREADANRAFRLRDTRTGIALPGEEFSSREEAAARANELNELEIARYNADRQAAIARQQSGTSASYVNHLGETVEAFGPDAHIQLDKIRQEEISNNPYVILDQNGRYYDSARSLEEAQQKYAQNLVNYTDQFGNNYGAGREGRLAFEQAAKDWEKDIENYDYYVNGKLVGRGQKGKEIAEKSGTTYDFGTAERFDNYDDAEKAFSRYVQAIEDRASDYESQGIETERAHELAKMDYGLSGITEGINETTNQVEARLREKLERVDLGSDLANSYIVPIETIISGIEDIVPELEAVDPAQVLQVWGRLPSEIQTIITEAGDAGQTTVEQVEAAAEAIRNVQQEVTFEAYRDIITPTVTSKAGEWSAANQQRINADQLVSIIRDKGIKNYTELLANTSFEEQQLVNSLVNSDKTGELANILSGALVENGEVKYEDTGLFDALVDWVTSKSSIGKRSLKPSEKADIAARGLDDIENGPTFYTQAAAEQAYLDYIDSEYDNYVKTLQSVGYSGSALDKNSYINTYVKTQADWMRDKSVLDDTEIAYLKEILGDENLVSDLTSENATDAQKKLARRLVNNYRYGGKGLSTADRLAGLNEVQAAIAGNKFTSDYAPVAAQYAQGFANWDKYSELLLRQANGEEVDTEALDMYAKQLEEFRKNATVELKIEGLQTLEQAGELLSGTASLVEQLQKGGRIEIEAVMSLRSDLHSEGQTIAMLNSGTAEQQYQAMMELTGATLAQIERNPEEYRNRAQAEAARRTEERRKQLEIAYAEATDKENFRRSVADEGWDVTGGDYVLGDQYTVTADGRILNKTTGLFDDDETRRYQAAQIKATYNGQPIDTVNPYFGKSESYRNLQLAQAAQNIVYGRMSRDEDYQLYDAAVNASGYWTQRLAWLESNDQQGTADYEKAQKNARLEADRAAREAQDSQRLEDLKLSGDTFGYAQEQYRQNNKAGLAANEIYKSLSNADVKSVDDLMSVLGNRNNAQNWKDLLESSPELAKKLSDLGLSFDEDFNWDNSGLLTSSDDAATALSILADAARSASDEFKHEDVQTTGQQYNNAIDYLNGNVLGEADEAVKFEAVRSIFGDAFANEVGSAYEAWNGKRENREEWENNYNAAVANRDYELATRLKENEVLDPGAFDWGANMTEYNRGQAQMLIDNAAYGQYGLTDLQKYNEMSRLFEAANTQGGIAELRKDDALGLYGQLVAGADGFEQWTKGVEALNAAGIALKDFNAESEECQKALGKAGIAVNAFADDHKKMASEMRAAEIETKKLYGENSSEIANRIRQLSKSEKDRAQALKEISANYDKFNQTGYARNQWNAGKKNYKDVASAIGQSEAYVKNMVKDGKKDVITKQLDLQFEIDEQQCLNDAEAQINSVLGQFSEGDQKQFYDFLVQMGINGEFDASNLEAVASQAEGVVAQIINELIAFMAAQSGSVTFGVDMNGDTATVKAKSVKMGGKGGGGYGGGGGGGGGSEKSAAQKLLEKQKRDIARYQHEIKMLEIEEEHYDRSNEYDTHMALLDAEIDKQRELQDLYRNNIGELESMLGSLSPDDDDYDNVLNALYDAKEQLADINNTIDEINAKRITIVTEKQENEDKPQGHKMTQIQNLATRYMDAKEYENYYKAMDLQLEATREQIEQNEGQIAEWENMLTQYQEGSDDWIEIRDKIWAMREENASLQNQALEDVIQMNQQKISQISEELEHGQQFSNHAINMNSTYGDMYNSNQQYADYRRTLTEQNTGYETNIQEYEVAIDRMRTLMATLDKTSDEWYSARDAIFQYEEAIASAKNAILENNQAIQESRVSELTTNYDHMTSDLQHEIKILQNQKQIYDDDNDYEAYVEMMRKEEQATIEMTNAMRGSLAEMEAEIGNVDQGSDAWWNLHDKILSVREAISDSEVSLENFENQIAQSKIDHLLEKFGRVDEMDQHNLKLIQYQETRYQNAGELTNYGTMLGIENEYQAKYAGDLEDHIRLLKNERDNVEIGSDAYYKLEQSIAKYEEQLRATNNTIEKNNRLIEENQEKIRQTIMAVENTVDKEYRARIQKTREMLAAEVNMQNTILDTIKKRYQDEMAQFLGPYQSNCWNTLKTC